MTLSVAELGSLLIPSQRKNRKAGLKWHRECYQDFTNKNKLDRLQPKNSTNATLQSKRQKRSSTETFDWKSMCLFSGISCFRQTSKESLSCVLTHPNVHYKLTTVVNRRNDQFLRDLVAVGARYHRACYQMYTSERNIQSCRLVSNRIKFQYQSVRKHAIVTYG